MIAGAHGSADETLRLHEYSPVFDAGRFSAHGHFVVEDVRRWVGARFGVALPPAATAVCGIRFSAVAGATGAFFAGAGGTKERRRAGARWRKPG